MNKAALIQLRHTESCSNILGGVEQIHATADAELMALHVAVAKLQ